MVKMIDLDPRESYTPEGISENRSYTSEVAEYYEINLILRLVD